MEVSVETTQGLERAMIVTIPAERIEREVEERLGRLRRTARINGFRPGKVPLSVVRKRYDAAVRYEVAEELIQASYGEAINQENLSPAGPPEIIPEQIGADDGLKYRAVFEVYPEVEVAEFGGITIERPVVTLSDDDVNKMIENLRSQQADWGEVVRAAEDGDQVEINFRGLIDGEPFDRGSAENVPLVLGSGSMIDGFEQGILGMLPEEQKSIEVTFPEDYGVADLAGKPAVFEITLNRVSERVLPEVDDEFMKRYGVTEGGEEAFRAQILENMQRECDQARDQLVKDRVMDGLYTLHDFGVPAALIESEAKRMAEHASSQQDIPTSSDLFKGEAERRVKLGLLIAEVVRAHNIQADPVRVQKRIETLAASYESPAEVVEWYNSNPEYLNGINSLVIEEQVVDLVMKEAAITDQEMGFEDLMTQANGGRG